MSAHRPDEHSVRNPLADLLVVLMRAWQLVPRIDPQRCRFYPSCSAYGITAVRTHGALRGGWMALRRLGRCHPWNPGGVDHVPPRVRGHVGGFETNIATRKVGSR